MKKIRIKNNKYALILVALLYLFNYNANAKTTTAIKNGKWEIANTWNNGLPEEWDIVIIPSGFTVTVSGVNGITYENLNVQVQGKMVLDNGQKLNLDCNSLYELSATGILSGVNGGSKLIVCDDDVFVGGGSDLIGPASFGRNPLPIELISFTATVKNNLPLLTWQTATETNNQNFTVEKSVNGINFSAIAEIAGAGNSTAVLSYSFIDNTPINGVIYYRLKQTDFDGKFSYSNIVSINNLLEANNDLLIYPNPISSNQSMKVIGINNNKAESISYEIIDISGRIVKSNSINNTESGIVEITDSNLLNAGTYFIKINGLVKKFVIE